MAEESTPQGQNRETSSLPPTQALCKFLQTLKQLQTSNTCLAPKQSRDGPLNSKNYVKIKEGSINKSFLETPLALNDTSRPKEHTLMLSRTPRDNIGINSCRKKTPKVSSGP
jgi:hypothetical protein